MLSQGIGFAITKRGTKMALRLGIGRTMLKQLKTVAELSAENAFTVVADVSKQAEVAAAFQKVVDHFLEI